MSIMRKKKMNGPPAPKTPPTDVHEFRELMEYMGCPEMSDEEWEELWENHKAKPTLQ